MPPLSTPSSHSGQKSYILVSTCFSLCLPPPLTTVHCGHSKMHGRVHETERVTRYVTCACTHTTTSGVFVPHRTYFGCICIDCQWATVRGGMLPFSSSSSCCCCCCSSFAIYCHLAISNDVRQLQQHQVITHTHTDRHNGIGVCFFILVWFVCVNTTRLVFCCSFAIPWHWHWVNGAAASNSAAKL